MAKQVKPKRSGANEKRSDTALLSIAVSNDLDLPGGEDVLPWALKRS